MVCQTHDDMIKALVDADQCHQTLMMLDYTDLVRDFETAYQIQQAFTAARNEPVVAYKLALTSKSAQTIMGTAEPLYGQQVQSRVLTTPAELELANMNEPMIGVTLIFTAKTDLSVGLSDEALLQQIQIAGGVEIVDSHFAHWFPAINKYLFVADGCLSCYIIRGRTIEGSELKPSELENINTELMLDEQRYASGGTKTGSESLLSLLQWFLHKLHQHHHQWQRGQILASGMLSMPVSMTHGEYCAHFSHSRLDSVLLHIAG